VQDKKFALVFMVPANAGWKVPDLTDPGELSYHVMRGKA